MEARDLSEQQNRNKHRLGTVALTEELRTVS